MCVIYSIQSWPEVLAVTSILRFANFPASVFADNVFTRFFGMLESATL